MSKSKSTAAAEHVHGPNCEHDHGHGHHHAHQAPAEPFRRAGPKPGRNESCPCGSGKKYKKCHGALADA